MMGEIHQMFMLFFSILYGIMLNSVIGLGAFPFGEALALKDLMGENTQGVKIWKRGYKGSRRLGLSIIILNFFPFLYFACIYYPIGDFLSLYIVSWTQIFCVGLLSLSVFAFYRFFLGVIAWKSSRFYTPYELEKHSKQRDIYPSSWTHMVSALGYLVIPWLVIFLFGVMNLLPN